MFTGLIEEVGKVKSIKNNEISIYCKKIPENSVIGDSISVNGVCLSITEKQSNFVKFHISPTTMKRSRFMPGDIRIGEGVNLERALMLSSRLGGHIVAGHVDGIAKIISVKKRGEDTYFELLYPKEIRSLIVPKGSISIDGISLTIGDVRSSSFEVTVIPHTLKETNLGQKRSGDTVHIEADVFARYIYHILQTGEINEKNTELIEKFCRW